MGACRCEKCVSKRTLMRECLKRLHHHGNKRNSALPSSFVNDLKDLLGHMNRSNEVKSVEPNDLKLFQHFKTPLRRFVVPSERHLNATRRDVTGQRWRLSKFISYIAQKYPQLADQWIENLEAKHN